MVQPHVLGLHGHHAQGGERAGIRRERGKVEQAQVAAELFVPADALVVVDGITAAVQGEPAPVDLDGAGVVGGMAVDQVGPAVDQPVGNRTCSSSTP